jgi:hypothetical protein
MEKFQPKKQEQELTEHAGIPGPELELPLHTPEPEIKNDIERKKISPEVLDDLIKKLPEDPSDDERGPVTPTLH